jgi:4-hydroxy-tetrahydrodipicolinate reductase
MAATKVCLVGATGRMGLSLSRALDERDDVVLVAAVARAGNASLGRDLGALSGGRKWGVPVTDALAAGVEAADVVIDFSHASRVVATLDACRKLSRALLVGTTGYDDATAQALIAGGAQIPLLVASNTSLALNVLLRLVRTAASALPADYDIEILETHHRHKIDAPSGTALSLGAAAAAGRGLDPLPEIRGTQPGPRTPGPIGYAVSRGGDVVGEHEVRFLGLGEQLRLSHIATDRAIFARGALTAAAWLAGQPAGRYTMEDVLSTKSAT